MVFIFVINSGTIVYQWS